jgi:hypothetical protein
LAKTRKAARKPVATRKASSAKTATGGKKKATRKKAIKPAKELDLRPLKKQLKAHVNLLSRSGSSDKRVQNAMASLLRLHEELNEECIPTMTIPLN